MSRRLKELVTKELSEKFKDTKSCVLVEYRGLNADQMNRMRRAFRKKQATVTVLKNSLASLAFDKVGMSGLKEFLQGPTAIVRGPADPAVLAKTVSECTKNVQGITVRGGFGEGMVFNAAQVKALATIPPREVLYARMLGSINGPMAALATAFSAIQRNLVCALRAMTEKKEKEAPAPAAAPPKEEKPAAAKAEAAAAAPTPAAPAAEKPAEAKPAEGSAPAKPPGQ